MRSELQEGTGFEIVDLQPDEAVEIGVMLGKYYSSGE
jgi:hypothetical protein